MKKYFGYIRVSTAKQGERGVSLQEQRDAIARHAQRNGLEISQWFEERETAAKRGRPVFTQMLKLLTRGKAEGVIIHKIDRSARNLKDWADLGELIDQGIEVHFANESLDLHSRGGRLSADIQAVVAADYIRNLREETRKGFYGRLKQGLYPLPAPIGYLDRGKGKPKEPDPTRAPFVRKAFEFYGTGRYTLERLVEELWRQGLRNTKGGKVTRNGMSQLLNNPFYIGLIRLARTGETFPGVHQALISKSLFDRVQTILKGKANARGWRQDLILRRLLICKYCGYSLIGEIQKGHTYYRCHTRGCQTKGVRAEAVEEVILRMLRPLQLDERERAYAKEKIARMAGNWEQESETQLKALRLRAARLQDRLARLTDAYIDRLIEKDIFEERKAAVLMARTDVEESIRRFNGGGPSGPDRLSKFLELANSAYSVYEKGLPTERRELLEIVTSNRRVEGKNVEMTLAEPFDLVATRYENSSGAPYRDTPRTWDKILPKLLAFFKENPAPTQVAD